MPQQNRVTPFGKFVATTAKGLFMGNRGNLHNARGELTEKLWANKVWVTCALQFKNYDSSDRKYTKLFFLDEATALAAGHRPCGTCRRKDLNRFIACWIAGNELPEETTLAQIDTQLHLERTVPHGVTALLDELPNGVFVSLPEEPETAWLLWNGELLRWEPAGYGERMKKTAGISVVLLTPLSTVNAIAAGYIPHVHHHK